MSGASNVFFPIALKDVELDLELEKLGLYQAKQVLADRLNIQIHLHTQEAMSFADLLNAKPCSIVLEEFATRIQAVNLTCSGSMFMKYWAVPLLFPYLYALLTEQVNLPWALSIFSVQMAPTWCWDRHLNLKSSFLGDIWWIQNARYDAVILKIFQDLNQIFEVISKVAKVQKFLLWENTALRILQFYDMMQNKGIAQPLVQRSKQQRQFLSRIPAEFFKLKQNPFLYLEKSYQPSCRAYQRKKCCFYFQLPEANNEYCTSCPLAKSKLDRAQTSCQIN